MTPLESQAEAYSKLIELTTAYVANQEQVKTRLDNIESTVSEIHKAQETWIFGADSQDGSVRHAVDSIASRYFKIFKILAWIVSTSATIVGIDKVVDIMKSMGG